MKGERVRITSQDGRTLTGTVAAVGDATWISSPSPTHCYLFLIQVDHRPQWPSMKARTQFLRGSDQQWYTEEHQAVTLQTLQPAEPEQPAGMKLVKR
jgi:hypothetical protein